MCLILFSWQSDPVYKLIVAANRDEQHSRASMKLHKWQDLPIIAGRDIRGGTTWMGLNTQGDFAAITNIDGVKSKNPALKSRGLLAMDFLTGKPLTGQYNPANLIAAKGSKMFYRTNEGGEIVSPGTHVLAVAELDEVSQRTQKGLALFGQAVTISDYFELLREDDLFIRDADYATVSSAVLRIRYTGEYEFVERRWNQQGDMIEQTTIFDKFIQKQ